eukprot:m.454930 g.454930  ORF g.454930 m.454930 type:complete len:651 (-) comp20776_c0_seq1:1037-2989(-)
MMLRAASLRHGCLLSLPLQGVRASMPALERVVVSKDARSRGPASCAPAPILATSTGNMGLARWNSGGAVATQDDDDKATVVAEEKTWVPEYLRREKMMAPEGFNRWMALPPVIAIQASVGSLYAWSIFNGPLCREVGVITSSSTDWGLAEVVPIFSTTAVTFGCCVWGLGRFIEKAGPRACGVLSTAFWGGGLALAGLGAEMHSLPLLYAGYGVLGGLGFAFGYISPLSNMVRWFPDKKGIATGLAVGGFGSGALLCAPLSEWLFTKYRQVPEFLGNKSDVNLVQEGGRLLTDVQGQLKEVVVATSETLSTMPGLVENGVYLAGTGSTGVGPTFLTLSALYTGVMLTGALNQKLPRSEFVQADSAQSASSTTPSANEAPYVPLETVTKLPQFYLIWLGIMGNAVSGVCIISCAKTIMSEIFGSQLPAYVDGAFCASYVAGLSLANLGGRLFWATASDKIGRRGVYLSFGALGVPTLLGIPYLTAMAASGDATTVPLWGFVAGSSLLISMYGGLLGVLPALVSDTFGSKNATSIFGRCMTGWATAALVGPRLMTSLRQSSYDEAVADLAARVDPSSFSDKFGAPVEQVQALVDAKTVTIPRLLELCPPGTLDPTIALYDSSLYMMAGALGGAFVCNAMVTPIAQKHFVTDK